MTWNHRMMRRRVRARTNRGNQADGPRETVYDIREVFYNGKGQPDGYTKDAMPPRGRTVCELRAEIVRMLKATYDPVFLHGHSVKPKPSTGKRRK